MSRSSYSVRTRAKRSGSSRIVSVCADSFGATSLRISSIASFVCADERPKKTVATRSSRRPERSIATIVFSNVGGSDCVAIASISASWSAIPRSNAG